MARTTYTYDPEKIQVRLGSVFLTGFSDTGKISIEKNEDDILPKVGVDGSVHYAINHDGTATATIPLMSTSPSLSYIRQLAKDNGEFTFTMTDLNDNGINVSSEGCRIIKEPDYIRNKETEEVELQIFIPFYK